MWTLYFYTAGERLEMYLDDIHEIGKILRFFPKTTEVQVYKGGSQYTNKMLNKDYDQIIDGNFSYEAIHGYSEEEDNK